MGLLYQFKKQNYSLKWVRFISMSNYVKATDFASKDALTTGNPLKIIKGTEINTEFNNIQTAIATKADLASPAFTGNPTAPTQAAGNDSSRIATTAFVQQEINANEANVAITGGTISGVAITGGTITGLATDLAVADGGTGASSFTLNSVVLGNNVGALNGNMVAPGASGNVLTSNGTTWVSGASGLGSGQTWKNMTSSRASATPYTNSTGKPIFVSVYTDGSDTGLYMTVDGLIIAYAGQPAGTGNDRNFVSGIVPNGSTYSVTIVAGSLDTWAELR